MSLFAELKRRNVFRVGIAYTVGAWLLLQFTDVLSELLNLPDTIGPVVVALVAIGLPIALFLAWAYEVTPEGVKRESEVDRSQSITPQTGKKLNSAILTLMAVAIAYLLVDKFYIQPSITDTSSGVAQSNTEADATAVAEDATQTTESSPEISRQSIAVLPFSNRSPDPDDAFFTEGIHDDLLTNLARIGSLKVISRTSVLRYQGTQQPIPDIARELGVATIMEGAVQRAGDTVRINVQLIDAQTDEHLWAEIFDRELTTDNLFAIQSEISQAIASALEATLTSAEEKQLATVPTQNLLAYEAYLRGKQLMARRESAALDSALAEFEKAVELDPDFALAWVGIGDSLILMGSYSNVTQMKSAPRVKAAAERALSINEGLGEAYATLAQVFSIRFGEWDETERLYRKAIELSPNYATAYHWYSNDLRFTPVRIDEAITLAQKALELDPNSAVIRANVANAYLKKGLYSIAERMALDNAALYPVSPLPLLNLANIYEETGRLSDAVSILQKLIDQDPGNLFNQIRLKDIYLELGLLEEAAAIRTEMQTLFPEHPAIVYNDITAGIYRDNQPAALEALRSGLSKSQESPFLVQYTGLMAASVGDNDLALDRIVTSNPGWNEPSLWAVTINQNPDFACLTAWLYIATGKTEHGEALLQQASRVLEQELPAVLEHADTLAPYICQAARGEFDVAMSTMEMVLSHNHLLYWKIFQGIGLFDPIRQDSRYLAIQAEHQRLIAVQKEALSALPPETGP